MVTVGSIRFSYDLRVPTRALLEPRQAETGV